MADFRERSLILQGAFTWGEEPFSDAPVCEASLRMSVQARLASIPWVRNSRRRELTRLGGAAPSGPQCSAGPQVAAEPACGASNDPWRRVRWRTRGGGERGTESSSPPLFCIRGFNSRGPSRGLHAPSSHRCVWMVTEPHSFRRAAEGTFRRGTVCGLQTRLACIVPPSATPFILIQASQHTLL